MITILLITLASIFNAAMDVLFTRFDSSVFNGLNPLWWDPRKSWKNKWSQPTETTPNKWYYFGFLPERKEAFPYSSTMLVWITDAWHLAKAIMLLLIMGATVCYQTIFNPIIDILLLYTVWGTVFTLFYSKVLIKRD